MHIFCSLWRKRRMFKCTQILMTLPILCVLTQSCKHYFSTVQNGDINWCLTTLDVELATAQLRRMLLTFKTVDQVIFKIDVDPAEKIKCLKARIQNDRGCEYVAEGMKLLFAGKILDDEKTINDYSISDKGYIVIMVPRPKTQGKECGKKSRSTQAITPVISTINESIPSSFDAYSSSTDPPSYSRQQGRYPRSGNSSEYETASQGRVYQSQVSTDGGQPAHGSKKQSFRSHTSSESSRRVVSTRVKDMSPDVVAGSSDYAQSLESYATCETGMLMSPVQSSDEQRKNQEVSNWLEKHVIEEPVLAVENSLSTDEAVIENVEKIVLMGFEREQAEVALNASFNSVEGAVEYLCTHIPSASAQPMARVPSFSWMPPVVQRFPSVVRSRTDLDDPLEFLKTNEEFQFLRLEVQRNPDLLASALDSFRSSHSDLEPVFKAFEDRLVELLTEPPDHSQSLASSAVAMETAQPPVNSLPTLDQTENATPTQPSPRSLDLSDPVQSSSSDTDQLLDQFDPTQSSSVDTDRLVNPPVASDDSTSSSIEQRVPPVGEDAGAIGASPEEDVGEERLEDGDELSEELIRALLLQDQEEEERMEAERAAAAAEGVSWNDAASLESGVAGGTGGSMAGGGGRGGRGGARMLEERGYVRVTMEEKQAIDRLKALGFAEERVVQVYLACDKNEEVTANILLDKD